MLPAPIREALDRDDAEAVLAYLRTLSRVEAQSYLRHMEGSGFSRRTSFGAWPWRHRPTMTGRAWLA